MNASVSVNEATIDQLKKIGWVVITIPPENIPDSVDKEDIEASLLEYYYDSLVNFTDEREQQEEREDNFRDDVEADADVLRSAGWGSDEDYYYGEN